MVTGVKLWGVTEKYLGEVGATGDYGKPLRDLSILGAEINRRWQSLPPGEKAEVASELLTNIAVPGALGKIGKSARIVERLEDLTDTLKKLKPEDKQAFCQRFGEFLDRLFPGPRHGELRPAYATAGGPPIEGPHRPRLTNQRPEIKKDENILLSQAEKDGTDNISNSNSPIRHPNEADIEKLKHPKEIKFQVDEATGRLQRTDMGKVRDSYTWEVIDESFSDSVVRQRHNLSCVSACGEMITNGQVKQDDLIEAFRKYVPKELRKKEMAADLEWLKKELIERHSPGWKAGRVEDNALNALLERGNFVAEFREPGSRTGHVVLIDGLSEAGRVIVRDSWEGTTYEMRLTEFFNRRTGRVCFR